MCLGEFTFIGQDDFLKGYNFLDFVSFIQKRTKEQRKINDPNYAIN